LAPDPSASKRQPTRRQAILALGLLAAALPGGSRAAGYPTRTVEIVVPYGAGGSTDFVARIIAQRLSERLGQPFVVVNKPGASGTIGLLSVMRAPPDGYTLLLGFTTEMVVMPQISPTARYAMADFTPIAVTGDVPVVMIGAQRLHSTKLQDLLAEVRGAPGKFTYGGGHGSPSHISGAWMNRIAGLDVVHVPYKGGAQAVGDVIGGHIDMFYGGLAAAKGAIDAGSVKAFAQTGAARSTALPNVPTFAEAGLPDFDVGSWTMLLAPKGTPADAVALLKTEVAAALATPQVIELLEREGVEPPRAEDPVKFLADEERKFQRLVRESGVSADN
jgi:tripartite-type tricarboxylate transporter receptor subunit TctC